MGHGIGTPSPRCQVDGPAVRMMQYYTPTVVLLKHISKDAHNSWGLKFTKFGGDEVSVAYDPQITVHDFHGRLASDLNIPALQLVVIPPDGRDTRFPTSKPDGCPRKLCSVLEPLQLRFSFTLLLSAGV